MFNLLCKTLISAPVLAYPNFSLPFIIQTDASLYAAGAVLSQVSLDGIERPIAYCSQTLNKHKCNYTFTEHECLAMIFALKAFRAYVYGTKFEIVTDHASLRWLHNLKEPEGRLACWALKLQVYDYSILRWPGSKHQNADILSQLPGVQALKAKSEDLFTYLLDQTKIHSSPDIQSIILRL